LETVDFLRGFFPKHYEHVRVQNLGRFEEAVRRAEKQTQETRGRPPLLSSEIVAELGLLCHRVSRLGLGLTADFYMASMNGFLADRDLPQISVRTAKRVMHKNNMMYHSKCVGKTAMRSEGEIQQIRERNSERLAFVVRKYLIPPSLTVSFDEVSLPAFPVQQAVWQMRGEGGSDVYATHMRCITVIASCRWMDCSRSWTLISRERLIREGEGASQLSGGVEGDGYSPGAHADRVAQPLVRERTGRKNKRTLSLGQPYHHLRPHGEG
jgi:hypothetical protein